MVKKVQFSVRLDPEVKEWLERLAGLNGMNLNEYIESLAERDINALDESTRDQILALQAKVKNLPFVKSQPQAKKKAA